MEKRIGNVMIQSPGGTAGKDSRTYKVSLPSSWVKAMGVTESDRQIELCFDGTTISISKRRSIQDFIQNGKARGDTRYLLYYYDGDVLCSRIAVDETERTLCVENCTDDVLHTAFGRNPAPTWEDLQVFLEERCVPRSRAGLREYLEAIGLDEYDPLEIIKKTEGRMAEDRQWIQVEVIG